MLPKAPGQSQLLRNLKKSAQIAVRHPKSNRHFISYPAMLAERQRQLLEGSKYIVHPYSFLSLYWKSLMVVINLSHMVISSLRLCYILEVSAQPQLHDLDHVLLAIHIVCLLDVAFKFNVGYREEYVYDVVIVRSLIACHYLCTWFLVDILSCLPLAYLCLKLGAGHRWLLLPHLLPLVRCARLLSLMNDLKNFMTMFTDSYIWHRSVQHAVLFLITMHCSSCLLFLAPVVTYYLNGKMSTGYCSFMKSSDGDLSKFSFEERYLKALFISISAFFGTGYSMFDTVNADEILINALIILYASIFMIYTLVLILKIYMTKFNSTMRYHELMNQVEIYMRHKQFSSQLQKRVRAFYNYRYQEMYFKEEAALDCLSEQLRNEINLHMCHKLVSRVALFEGLPAGVVGTVLGCLRPEVYMCGDLVVRAGECGDCMYFIAYGTVAVYSLKGDEVCHLEDGAHFGEVALLMKDSKRVATVVAVEITLVYRLDGPDFRDFIMTYQELYQRIEALASKRMHETVLIDKAFQSSRHTI